jgi:hypothetical protein
LIIHESEICSIVFPGFSSSGQRIDVSIFKRQEGENKTTACLAVWLIDNQWEKSVNVVVATSKTSILSMLYDVLSGRYRDDLYALWGLILSN